MGLLRNAISRVRGGNPLNIRNREPIGPIELPISPPPNMPILPINPIPRDLPLPPGPILPPRGRPIPPISIGGIGGIGAINPINIGQPVPSPIDKLPSPGAGVPSELLPIKGGPRPIPVQPITRPLPPIGGVFDDSLQNIDLPIDDRALKPRGIPIGNNVPGGGGINYGPDSLTPLQPPADDPFARTRVNPIQELRSPLAPPVLPDPRTNMNIETRDTEFGPVTISSPAFPVRGRQIPLPDIGPDPIPAPVMPGDQLGGIDPNTRISNYFTDRQFGVVPVNPPQLPDLPPELRPIEQPPSNDSERFLRGPTDGEPFVLRDLDGNLVPTGTNEPRVVNAFDDRASRPRGPIVGGIVPGGGGIDYGPGMGGGLIPPQDFGFGPGIRPTEIFDEQGNIVVGSGGVTPDPIVEPVSTPDPVVDPVSPVSTTPAAVATDVGTDPAVTTPATVAGSVDPVLAQQDTVEDLSDPLVRALYFGTADQPGFINQLQQAGANLIGSQVPLQQTAGLTPLELLARQQAVAGLGGFEPFFQQNKDLVDQAIGQSRRAEALRDPYFQRAEQQMLLGLGDQLGGIDQARGITIGATDRFGRSLGRLGRQQIGATDAFGRRLSDVEARGEGAAGRFGESLGGIEAGAVGATDMFGQRLGESEDLIRGTLGGYDQGLTQQFYNPFEDAVVQQTIDDVIEAGEKQDMAARAREIGAGAFGGSRARLSAAERREALGKGLAESLGRIRQQGFGEAQRIGLSEFARQREAERAASRGLSGLAGTRFGAETGLLDRLTSGAQQRLAAEKGVVDLLGRTGQQQLGAQQQLGSTLRGFTGDQFGAQRQLAQSLLGFGSAGAGARQNLASGLLGIGQQRGAGAQQLGQSLAGFGQQIGGIGSSLDSLRRGERGELARFGGIGRGIAETGLGRLFEQQTAQQLRPLQTLGQIGQFLPQFQQGRTRIESQYRLPSDPTALGLGAAFGAYTSLKPPGTQTG